MLWVEIKTGKKKKKKAVFNKKGETGDGNFKSYYMKLYEVNRLDKGCERHQEKINCRDKGKNLEF